MQGAVAGIEEWIADCSYTWAHVLARLGAKEEVGHFLYVRQK